MIYIFNMEIALVRIIDVLTDEISFAILGSDVEQFFFNNERTNEKSTNIC